MNTIRRAHPLLRATLVSTLAAGVATAPVQALWEAAEGEVFLSLDASISADSNIASNAFELSDTVYSLTPGISWERSRGRASVSLSGACEIERASEYEGYDSENYSADFLLDMPVTPGGRLNGSFSAGYFDGSRIDSSQNTRVAESSFDLGLNGSYQISSKTNGRAGASYSKTEPDLLADYSSTTLSAGLGYNFRPQVSFYVDARFTESSSGYSDLIGSGTDTSGNAILFGLDGQITDKLSGHIGVGYDWSESESSSGVSEFSGVTYDIGLTWSPRERTSIGLNASNGVHSTSTGGTESMSVGVTLTQEIGLNMSADSSLTYRKSEFISAARGDDEVVDASIGLRYRFTSAISAHLGYTYTDSDSTSALTEYTRSVWELSATARF